VTPSPYFASCRGGIAQSSTLPARSMRLTSFKGSWPEIGTQLRHHATEPAACIASSWVWGSPTGGMTQGRPHVATSTPRP
jgi:hypothetical protein